MIADSIAAYSDQRNGPNALDVRPAIASRRLPDDYYAIVGQANGFVLRHGVFRLFGLEGCGLLPSVAQWNASPWVSEYGDLARDLIFVAEDLFGDQYGYSFRNETPRWVKFRCEGGTIEDLGDESLEDWLGTAVLVASPSAFDWNLSAQARLHGLNPTPSEHLSFALPLITGGEDTLANLEVLDSQFHLHLLGQLSLKNRLLPDGVRISRFWPES